MSDKPRTAEQACILFRQIIRELPEEERGRLIYFAGIADRPDTAEDAMGFFKEMLAKLPGNELSELCVEFRSGLDGQEDRIFVASMPDEADYMIIPNELGEDALLVLTAEMFQDLVESFDANEKKQKNLLHRIKNMVPKAQFETLMNGTLEALQSNVRYVERIRELSENVQRHRSGSKARAALASERVKIIDDLLTKGHKRQEIPGALIELDEQREEKKKLWLPAWKGKKGERLMWRSYRDAGGCHSAVAKRGRPKNN